jgi:AcrR family transcriptional regulator
MGPRVRRGARSAGKGDLREEAILETAERLLAEKPYREIGVGELARGAGISRPTFYFYFDSKGAVLSALVGRIADEMYRASYAWCGGEDPVETTRASLAAAARLWREHGPVLRAAVETWGSVPEMRRFWEEAVARFVEASAGEIERARREGAAVPGPPDSGALATALIWMNERCFYTHSVGASPSLPEEELVETLTTIWVRAVYGGEPPAGR